MLKNCVKTESTYIGLGDELFLVISKKLATEKSNCSKAGFLNRRLTPHFQMTATICINMHLVSTKILYRTHIVFLINVHFFVPIPVVHFDKNSSTRLAARAGRESEFSKQKPCSRYFFSKKTRTDGFLNLGIPQMHNGLFLFLSIYSLPTTIQPTVSVL